MDFDSLARLAATLILSLVGWTAGHAQPGPVFGDVFSQYRTQERFDLASQAEENDRSGSALAIGDFNGDGYDDLAIGCAYEDSGPTVDSGWVSVLYGGPNGADASNGIEELWDQEGDVDGGLEPFDRLGFSLAVGDFNGDTFDDLVIGAPYEHIGSLSDTGSINVIYGAHEGLQLAGNLQFWQAREIGGHSVAGANEAGDNFGYSLAVGNFNGDEYDDLAIGVPNEDIGTVSNAGGVVVLYGKPVIGLDPELSTGPSRDDPGMDASPGTDDLFGFALAAGDFNGDDFDDLAIGVPGDNGAAGAVETILGADGGLDLSTNQVTTLFSAAAGDGLGWALTVGDFDNNGLDDIAAGIPGRDVDGAPGFGHGSVVILYGGGTSTILEQGGGGLAELPDGNDAFGESLAAGDVNGDGVDDLLVGVPGEPVVVSGSRAEAGAVQWIYGSAGVGLVRTGSTVVDYHLVGTPSTGDQLGTAVALGDFDGDGRADSAFTVPFVDFRNQDDDFISSAGEIIVIHTGTIFNDGFEEGDTDGWTAVTPRARGASVSRRLRAGQRRR